MTGITSSLSSLLQGILDTLSGIFNTLLSSIESVLALFGTAVEDVAGLGKSIVELILGNIIPIGIILAALVGFSAYQQRRGQQVQGSTFSKKLQ